MRAHAYVYHAWLIPVAQSHMPHVQWAHLELIATDCVAVCWQGRSSHGATMQREAKACLNLCDGALCIRRRIFTLTQLRGDGAVPSECLPVLGLTYNMHHQPDETNMPACNVA
jgi:hypothetical protein